MSRINFDAVAQVGLKWARGPARFESGCVLLDARLASPVDIPASSDLAVAFAAVRSEGDIRRFVGEHGLLTQGPGTGEAESVGFFVEQISCWERSAALVRAVLTLYSTVRTFEQGKASAKDLRAALFLPDSHRQDMPIERHAWLELAWQTTLMLTPEDPAPLVVAPSPVRHGGVVLALGVRNLQEQIAFSTVKLLGEQLPIGVCRAEDCSRVFVIRDQRQTYCSAQCSGRVRMRRFLRDHPRRTKDGTSRA